MTNECRSENKLISNLCPELLQMPINKTDYFVLTRWFSCGQKGFHFGSLFNYGAKELNLDAFGAGSL